jgi:membrane protein implicated in regulation of membrane protease activity
MTWIDLYLSCLIVGLSLSMLSLLTGAFHVHLPGHWGHIHFGGHTHVGAHTHVGSAGAPGQPRAAGASQLSFANFSSLLLFLAWFGGAGVVLRGGFHLPAPVALVGAVTSGLFGAYLVFLFVRRVLLANDHSLRAGDYALPGTLGTITLAIRAGGTGEIAYVQGGTRKSAAARSEKGKPVCIGSEVVVIRFADGIAYVRLWDAEKP